MSGGATPGVYLFSATPLTKPVGTVIDSRYEIQSLVGIGGMSAVYRVNHEALGRIVALKMLHPHITESRANVERFLQEAKAEGLIQHKNVIGVHAMGATEDGHLFLIMDFLEGMSLATWLSEYRHTDREAVNAFLQICDGLQAAHDQGIIHRDLKPSNIMLTGEPSDPTVKIVDFGIAKFAGTGLRIQDLTKAGAVLGSPNYMSPEQCDSQKVDLRTDIYSLGCLMYEVLTGVLPLEGESEYAIMTKHVGTMPRRLREVKPTISQDLDNIVWKCLQKNPADRYLSVSDLREALEGASLLGSAPAMAKKKSPLIIGAAAVVAVAIGASIWAVNANSPSPLPAPAGQSTEATPQQLLLDAVGVADARWNSGEKESAISVYNNILQKCKNSPGLYAYSEVRAALPNVAARADVQAVDSLIALSSKFVDISQFESARICAEAARQRAHDAGKPFPEGLAEIELAKIDVVQSRLDLADSAAESAMAHFQSLQNPQNNILGALSALANKYWLQAQDAKRAGALEEQAVQLAQNKGMDRTLTASLMADRALNFRRESDYARAAGWYQKAIDLRKKILNSDDPVLTLTIFEAGNNAQLLGDLKQSARYYDQCLPNVASLLGDGGSEAQRIVNSMAAVYEHFGQTQKAKSVRALLVSRNAH